LLWPVLAAVLALILQLSGALASGERLLRDALLRGLHPRPADHVAVVLVDEAAIRAAGRWPWRGDLLAQLVDRMIADGAHGIAVDLLLPEVREGDERLAAALARGPGVLAAGLDDEGAWLLPNPRLRAIPLGHVSFDLDRDGVIRRFAATKQVQDRLLPALAVAAARLADPGLAIPVAVMLRPGFRNRPIPTVSAAELLAGRGQGRLRGRVAFLGTSAAGIGDRFVSPVSRNGSPDPGVLIEAQAAEAILSGDLLRPAPPLAGALLAAVLAWLGLALLDQRRLALLAPLLLPAPLLAAAAALRFLRVESEPLAVLAALLAVGLPVWILAARRARRAMGAARERIAELEELQVALAETGRLDAEARRVVANELKTPLTSVKGLAQLLEKFDLSGAERSRVAHMVVTETSRLAQMVDALLDLERLRLREPGRDAQVLDLSALCAERAGYLDAGTGRELVLAIAPGVRVRGDRALLERVIENLVANACKFSPEGTPVRLGLRAQAGLALLEVEDQGPGIPEPDRARIFGRFQRGAGAGLAPGLGLGLALVAEVAAWHGGAVTVAPGTAGGARFQVRLPLATP
jgi:signal transduction histidine kinase